MAKPARKEQGRRRILLAAAGVAAALVILFVLLGQAGVCPPEGPWPRPPSCPTTQPPLATPTVSPTPSLTASPTRSPTPLATQTIVRPTPKPGFSDEFGCLPADCTKIADAAERQFCQEYQGGTYVWALDCSTYPSGACSSLCRSELASHPVSSPTASAAAPTPTPGPAPYGGGGGIVTPPPYMSYAPVGPWFFYSSPQGELEEKIGPVGTSLVEKAAIHAGVFGLLAAAAGLLFRKRRK